MKTSDYILIGVAALGAYAVFDMARISDRFYLSDAENARMNINLAKGWGLITPAAADTYQGAITAGTVTPKSVTLGLLSMEIITK